eukprot:TRINITY_DN9755_c0_g2_i3.p1 TRINITY_DN9755_c0_g2~~TRINITY_DN9755_c0_g2_i3.p1  ORF type:complete len:379 (+),score=39.01 TRINITY_DN9755_c0_g2_i3:317-1453(+)
MSYPAGCGTDATDSWYSEIQQYSFSSHSGNGTGHFTQLVWKQTATIGAARSQDGKYIVANYSPPGNWKGEYPQNVLPPGATAPTNSTTTSNEPIKVRVPVGAKAGDPLTVKSNGESYTVDVPAGAKPGETFSVELPDAPAPAPAPRQRSRSEKQPIKVRVPSGAKAGDPLTVKSNGESYTVNVPAGAKPGETFSVELPDAPAPAPAPRQRSRSEKQPIKVRVPSGAKAGDPLTVKNNGESYTVNVPAGAKPGETFLVELPDAPAPAPAPRQRSRSEKQPIKVRVPSGAKAGDPLTVKSNGESYTVNVPAGAKPGETFLVELPDAPAPAPAPRQRSRSEKQPIKVRVPSGAKAGDPLTVKSNGESYTCLLYTSPSPRDS